MKKLNYEKINMQGKNRENQPFNLPAHVEPGTSIKKIKPLGLFMNLLSRRGSASAGN